MTLDRSRKVRHLLARPLLLVAAGGALVGIAALAAISGAQPATVLIEDWSQLSVGQRGIPPGWQGHKWGSPKYDFTVIQDSEGKALLLKSDNRSEERRVGKECKERM